MSNYPLDPGVPDKTTRIDTTYLDGLRGLAALYVVFNHCSIMTMELTDGGASLPHRLAQLEHLLHFFVFNYGTLAIAILIVLSGYLLMLPVAKTPALELRGGTGGFVKRRARRILPPYYAALGISLLFIWMLPAFGVRIALMPWHDLIAGTFHPGSLLSHVLLVHNLTPWIATTDPPMWSVPVEWQIYFLFALVMLPLVRKTNDITLLLVTFGIFLPLGLIYKPFTQSHSWFVGLFALGMVGARINFSPEERYQKLRTWPHWRKVAASAFILILASIIAELKLKILPDTPSIPEILTGIATVSYIIATTQAVASAAAPGRGHRVLTWRPVEVLGVFSYSLYLIHDPVLEITSYYYRISGLSGTLRYFLFPLTSIPLALAVAFAFHLVFEKPFLPAGLRLAPKPNSM